MSSSPRPTRWPATFRLGPFRWRLTRDQAELDRGKAEVGDADLHGYAQVERHVVVVKPDLAADEARHVLMHELLHVAVWHGVARVDDDDEERVVAAAAPWLLELLRANPRLVAVLLGD